MFLSIVVVLTPAVTLYSLFR